MYAGVCVYEHWGEEAAGRPSDRLALALHELDEAALDRAAEIGQIHAQLFHFFVELLPVRAVRFAREHVLVADVLAPVVDDQLLGYSLLAVVLARFLRYMV